jgi:hypothetical protein
LFVTARLQLGKSFAVTPQAKELVTLGLYSRIPNPIYVFVDVMIFGLILALHLYWLFAFFRIGGHACISSAPESQGPARKVWPSLPGLSRKNLVLKPPSYSMRRRFFFFWQNVFRIRLS